MDGTSEVSRRSRSSWHFTGTLTVGWFRSTLASPAAWAVAALLAAFAPAVSVLTARGTLVLRDLHSTQAQIDLTWLGSVAAILAALFWIPRAAGFRDGLGRGRQWMETANLILASGVLGAGLAHAWSLAALETVSLTHLPDHVGAVLQVSGLAMVAATVPVSRRAPAWTVLAAIGCAEAFPSSTFGRAVGIGVTVDASQLGTWLIVGGLWIASAPAPRFGLPHP